MTQWNIILYLITAHPIVKYLLGFVPDNIFFAFVITVKGYASHTLIAQLALMKCPSAAFLQESKDSIGYMFNDIGISSFIAHR